MFTDSVKNTHRFYVSPTQNGKMTTIDEIKFVNELFEDTVGTCEKYGIQIAYSVFVATILTKYAYTELGITERKDNERYVFETMKQLAMNIYGDDLFTKRYETFDEVYSTKSYVKHSFEYGYMNTVIFGKYDRRGRLYGGIFHKRQAKTFNKFELAIELRPLRIERDIVFYKSEIDKLLEVFDDFHDLMVAFSLMVKAKVFENSRMWYEENGFQKLLESKHWWTPCNRMKQQKILCGEVGFAPSKVGVVKENMMQLESRVLRTMKEHGLVEFEETLGMTSSLKGSGFKVSRYGFNTFVEYKCRKWDWQLKCYTDWQDATYMLKQRQGHAYKMLFLQYESDDEVAFSITYDEYTHGYVFNFIEYLCEIKHSCMERMKCRIFTCKDCGKRVCELIELGTERRGRKSNLCSECGSSKGRTARSRKKKGGEE